jgi:hypothetical protein
LYVHMGRSLGRPAARTVVQDCRRPVLTNIDRWAQQILHHGRPGTSNAFIGVALDFVLRVYYRTVFGLRLASILQPTSGADSTWFMRLFIGIMARPGLYSDTIQSWNGAHPERQYAPFQYTLGSSINLTRFRRPDGIDRLTDETVLQYMIEAGIPIAWVDHSYAFALRWLAHHYPYNGRGGEAIIEWARQVDDERIERLHHRGVPPTIRQWSGWRLPTTHDITRVQYLMRRELEEQSIDCFSSADWLLVGQDPIFHLLPRRHDYTEAQRNLLPLATHTVVVDAPMAANADPATAEVAPNQPAVATISTTAHPGGFTVAPNAPPAPATFVSPGTVANTTFQEPVQSSTSTEATYSPANDVQEDVVMQ